jgi:PTH2 family peptidyl-tRNA hydrolase
MKKSKIKQVMVIRRYYPDGNGGTKKIRTGKMIAQACHASLMVFTDISWINLEDQLVAPLTYAMIEWLKTGTAKICVYVDTEEELLEIYNQGKSAGIPTSLVTDSGITVFHGEPTNTVVALGPDYDYKIDLITGGLKLL